MRRHAGRPALGMAGVRSGGPATPSMGPGVQAGFRRGPVEGARQGRRLCGARGRRRKEGVLERATGP